MADGTCVLLPSGKLGETFTGLVGVSSQSRGMVVGKPVGGMTAPTPRATGHIVGPPKRFQVRSRVADTLLTLRRAHRGHVQTGGGQHLVPSTGQRGAMQSHGSHPEMPHPLLVHPPREGRVSSFYKQTPRCRGRPLLLPFLPPTAASGITARPSPRPSSLESLPRPAKGIRAPPGRFLTSTWVGVELFCPLRRTRMHDVTDSCQGET